MCLSSSVLKTKPHRRRRVGLQRVRECAVLRRRQVVHHRVEQGLDATVPQRRAAEHRHHRARETRTAERGAECVGADGQVVGPRREQLGVVLGDGFDHAGVDRFDEVDERLVSHPLQQHGLRVEPGAEVRQTLLHRRTGRVELVDEAEPGHGVAPGLAPHALGLRLDSARGVEHDDGAVEHTQRALDLDGEVDVPGRVDERQRVPAPRGGGRGRGDGDAVLALLGGVVERGGAVVHLAHAVNATAEEEQPFADGGLACVDVREHAEQASEGDGSHGGVSVGERGRTAGVRSVPARAVHGGKWVRSRSARAHPSFEQHRSALSGDGELTERGPHTCGRDARSEAD